VADTVAVVGGMVVAAAVVGITDNELRKLNAQRPTPNIKHRTSPRVSYV